MNRLASALPWIAAVGGVLLAYARRWVADDAYISFRYAQNLVEGHGLVYNVGERVEGYTNFAWTLWSALGLALGMDAGGWATFWGLACYAALLGVLACDARVGQSGAQSEGVVPVAAMIVACDPLLWTFATSGLETAAFCLLVVVCLRLGARPVVLSARARVGSGALFGLLCLVRPDGLLFAFVVAAVVLLARSPLLRDRVLALAQLAAGGLLVVLPHLAFRLTYYGDALPNTFYAKSALLPWYSQGLAYAGYYLQLAWPLTAALVLVVLAAVRRRTLSPAAWPALAAAAVYTFYVVRVGGDFMLGRLLVPVSVLLAWSLGHGVRALWPERSGLHLGVVVVVVAGFWLTAAPDARAMWRHGIADERTFPDPVRADATRAETLRRYFEGLDVRVAFTGGDARLMYEARVPTAIEAETGLTDRTIARQPLKARGRVGHEKHASLEYLRRRGAHFVLRVHGLEVLRVAEQLPLVEVRMDGVRAFCLRWDAALMEALRQRGARFRRPPESALPP